MDLLELSKSFRKAPLTPGLTGMKITANHQLG